jgi:peptidoglycan/xylan/chitin deacetylase (PgdA/CDA1 family)
MNSTGKIFFSVVFFLGLFFVDGHCAKVHYSGDPSRGVLSLTFDDGPHPEYTPRILDILKTYGVRATFFVLGQNVKQHPEIVRRMVREGHQVANHSYTHPSFVKVRQTTLDKQIEDTNKIIEEVAGVLPTSVRPPYGALNDRVIGSILDKHGLNIIMWSVDPQDWRRPGIDVVVQRVMDGAKPGSVILLHDIHKQTAQALPSILTGLLAKGYQFATIDQLFGIRPRHSSLSTAMQGSEVITSALPALPTSGSFAPAGAGAEMQSYPLRQGVLGGQNVRDVTVQRPMVAPPGVVHGRVVPVMRAESVEILNQPQPY